MKRETTRPEKNPNAAPRIDERRLVRLLLGELAPEEAAELRRRLAGDPSLSARYRKLERLWKGLALPPPDAAPPGFAARVAARAAESSGRTWTGAGAPFGSAWARAAAGAALAVGLGLGAGVGWIAGERGPEVENLAEAEAAGIEGDLEATGEWAYLEDGPPTLAESYWDAFYEAGEEEL